MLQSAHFSLRKWSSNSEEVLNAVPPEFRETQVSLSLDSTPSVKTLGLQWHPHSDLFPFTVCIDLEKQHTKRSILSDILKLYDPLGWFSPVVVRAKIFIQSIWAENLGWDDKIPTTLATEWLNYARNLKELEKQQIPWSLQFTTGFTWELHGLADASSKAYAAAIYLRGKKDGNIICRLVASKTRVAPIKLVTIPRLELLAAVLLANLMKTVSTCFGDDLMTHVHWTDSTVALNWIHAQTNKWKLFVSNRVNQIHDLTEFYMWFHVKTDENPADCASRGLGPEELADHPLWCTGPQFLHAPYKLFPFEKYPQFNKEEKTSPPVVSTVHSATSDVLHKLSRISAWTRAVRITALILWIFEAKSFKSKALQTPSPSELEKAERKIFLLIQQEEYKTELTEVAAQKRTLSKRDRFKNLNLFIDAHGLLRVGGRLQKSAVAADTKNPIILPGGHPLVKSMMLYHHYRLAHGGKAVLHTFLRQTYWILNAMKSIKSVIDKCLLCFRYRAKPTTQILGQLPSARVNAA